MADDGPQGDPIHTGTDHEGVQGPSQQLMTDTNVMWQCIAGQFVDLGGGLRKSHVAVVGREHKTASDTQVLRSDQVFPMFPENLCEDRMHGNVPCRIGLPVPKVLTLNSLRGMLWNRHLADGPISPIDVDDVQTRLSPWGVRSAFPTCRSIRSTRR